MKKSKPRPLAEERSSLRATKPAKSKASLKATAKRERPAGEAHKAARRVGRQSKEEAQASASRGRVYSAPASSRGFARAAEALGPPKRLKLGAAAVDAKPPREDLATERLGG